MTLAQRALLGKFSAGDKPLNRAIKAALSDIDRMYGCPTCKGSGSVSYSAPEFDATLPCHTCVGTGRGRS